AALRFCAEMIALIFPPHFEDDEAAPKKRSKKDKESDDTVAELEVDERDVLESKPAEPAKKARKKRDDEPQSFKVQVAAAEEGAPVEVIENDKTEISEAPPVELLGPRIVEPLAAKKKELVQKVSEAPKVDELHCAGGERVSRGATFIPAAGG